MTPPAFVYVEEYSPTEMRIIINPKDNNAIIQIFGNNGDTFFHMSKEFPLLP